MTMVKKYTISYLCIFLDNQASRFMITLASIAHNNHNMIFHQVMQCYNKA